MIAIFTPSKRHKTEIARSKYISSESAENVEMTGRKNATKEAKREAIVKIKKAVRLNSHIWWNS